MFLRSCAHPGLASRSAKGFLLGLQSSVWADSEVLMWLTSSFTPLHSLSTQAGTDGAGDVAASRAAAGPTFTEFPVQARQDGHLTRR